MKVKKKKAVQKKAASAKALASRRKKATKKAIKPKKVLLKKKSKPKVKTLKAKAKKPKARKAAFAKAPASRRRKAAVAKALASRRKKTVKKIVKKVAKKAVRKATKKPKPRIIFRTAPQNTQATPEGAFPAQALFKAKIKVIGIGGGGGSIVSEIGRSLGKAGFVNADTDMRSFKNRKGIKNFFFGEQLTHGLGTGLNPELAEKAAESEKERISQLFAGQDIVILIASLGGGVGSGATKIFAEASKKFDCITFGIFTLPFKFEGKNKYGVALKALKELRKSLNVSITIPNEKIFKVIDENTSITEAFSLVNKNLINSLESLIDLIYNPGVINIDFADLKAILRGRGNLAFLNTSEVTGKNGAEKIMQEILNNPLYQSNNFIAEKILFNIAGSNSLSMLEVDKISRAISSQNPKAKIIFGISKNASYKNKIKTTLLMTGPATGAEAKAEEKIIAEKEEPIKEKKAIIKVEKKPKKKVATPKPVQEREKITIGNFVPSFNSASADVALTKMSAIDHTNDQKRTLRRTALEIKKAQEMEENEKSQQEKEWEIPAFLRFKK